MHLLPLNLAGARETAPRVVDFGIFLPHVTRALGTLAVKLIHEDDQFLQRVAPVEVPMTHSVHPQYGDLWSGTVNFNPAARDRRIEARAQGDEKRTRPHPARRDDRPRGLDMNVGSWLLWGFVATGVLTAIAAAGRRLHCH
jgi:hypothetical protein